MQSLARRNGGRCLSKAFVNMNTKLRWQCEDGHEWQAIPLSIKHGTWCPVCAGHVPLNIRDLKQMAKERGGKCLSNHYVNSSSKLRWKCAKGHEWEAVASSVKAGTWCPVCVGRGRTIEDIQQLASLKGGRCLSATFAGMNKRLRWQCAEGHIWQAIPKNIQKGHWCPSCARSQPRKYSLADFERIARRRGGHCLSTEFKSVCNKLLWECAKGHRWEAVPLPIKKGTWCPFCVGRHKTIADMQDIAKKRGGRCLARSYLGKEKKLLWECSLGHRWNAVPHSIGMGTWCPVCAGTQKLNIEEMHRMATLREGRCLSKEYVGIESKLLWECVEGHRWEAQPNNIRSGNWCPKCSSALGERICREYFEQLFRKPFPKLKPAWLRLDRRTRLELDGYCEELGLAFEHQGPHHYGKRAYYSGSVSRFTKQRKHDRLKRLRCRKNGVVLISVPEIPARLPQSEVRDFIRCECEKRGVQLPNSFDTKKISLRNAYAVPETRRQLERLSAIAKHRGGKCLSREYKGHYVKLRWQCSKMHVWHATPADIKCGNWCPYCSFQRLTIHDMRATAEKKGGKCLSWKYSGGKVKLIWECAKRHHWRAVPSSVRAGCWCPVCAGIQRLTIEDIQKTARKRGGKCLSNKYVNGGTKLRWRCSKGHEWEAVPDSIRQGTWCPRCAAKERVKKRTGKTAPLTIARMRQVAAERRGACLSKTYRDLKTKMRWRCSEGHEWTAAYNRIRDGAWCSFCAASERAKNRVKKRETRTGN